MPTTKGFELLGSYNAAVSALRQSLGDPDASTAIETLLAAQLVGCFESLFDNGNRILYNHLKGLVLMIQHREPLRSSTKLELDLTLLVIVSLFEKVASRIPFPLFIHTKRRH